MEFLISPKQSIQARELLGWTIDDLSKIIGVEATVISAFEQNTRQVSGATVLKLMHHYEVSGVFFEPDLVSYPKNFLSGITPDPVMQGQYQEIEWQEK